MDISFWTKYNPKITLEHTSKKFYGQYLYKLVVYAPAGRLITSAGDLTDELNYRKNFNYNYGGSWWVQRKGSTALVDASVDLLESLRNLKNDNLPNIKIRVEEPRVQIYATGDKDLEQVAAKYLSSAPIGYIESIAGPADMESEIILNSGAIIRKNDIGYKYKIILKDGSYSANIKHSILTYLENLGPELVKIPRGTHEMLVRSQSYTWGCYFYANDLSIVTSLHLMSPGIVTNSHELVVLAHK